MKILILLSYMVIFPLNLDFFLHVNDSEREIIEDTNIGGSVTMQLKKKMFDKKVKIFEHKEYDEEYGFSVWMNQSGSSIKTKYFAHKTHEKSVFNRYKDWLKKRKVIFFSSGAFTSNDYSSPVGITVDNGKVVNRKMKKDAMDALTIIDSSGKIRVEDLDKESLEIKYSETGKSRKINPKSNVNRLLDWAEVENATIFQTQLLAFNNQLRIPRVRGDEMNYRERRVLALAKKNNALYYIIFYIKKEVTLFDASRSIFILLKEDNSMDIQAMINLDTGMFDIQKVYNERGKSQKKYEGVEDPETATNLITFYYDK